MPLLLLVGHLQLAVIPSSLGLTLDAETALEELRNSPSSQAPLLLRRGLALSKRGPRPTGSSLRLCERFSVDICSGCTEYSVLNYRQNRAGCTSPMRCGERPGLALLGWWVGRWGSSKDLHPLELDGFRPTWKLSVNFLGATWLWWQLRFSPCSFDVIPPTSSTSSSAASTEYTLTTLNPTPPPQPHSESLRHWVGSYDRARTAQRGSGSPARLDLDLTST